MIFVGIDVLKNGAKEQGYSNCSLAPFLVDVFYYKKRY
jgi:hypothetical protein